MSNLTDIKVVTFNDIISNMEKVREEGGTGIVKRENFRDYPQVANGIHFGVSSFPFASFGYIERLIRKLAVEYSGVFLTKMNILQYREACGYFSGELELFAKNSDSEITDKIKFSWSGNGPIEETWDKFVEWEKTVITNH